MLALTTQLAMQLAIVTTGAPTYHDAYYQAQDTGKPLLVLVGADWCPGCRIMKQDRIPELQRNGALDGVAFAAVNTDRQSELAQQIMRGGSIPQLILYTRDADGWHRTQLTGVHSRDAIRRFLAERSTGATSSMKVTVYKGSGK